MISLTRTKVRYPVALSSSFKGSLTIAAEVAIGLMGLSYFWNSSASFAAAQSIIPDQTLPPNQRSIASPVVPSVDLITGGATHGSNLFHSFQQFNIEAGRGAYFLDPGNIQNIFSRVTGSSRSDIFGTLGTILNSNGFFAPSNANLFLINPNGIVFGPGARLDLAGSFVATTATAIQFGNQGIFAAINPATPDLLTVNPSAFLFNQIAAQPIVVRSPARDFTKPDELARLAVNPNRSLLLVGGDVRLEAGLLEAESGRIELAGLASSGTIGLSADNNNPSLNFPSDAPRANVALTNASTASVNGQGGTISIYADNVDLLGGSSLFSGVTVENDPTAKGGDIRINATGMTTIAGSGLVRFPNGVLFTQNSSIFNFVGGVGDSGNIVIQTGSLNVQAPAQLAISITGKGNAGDLFIQARNRVLIDGAILSSGISADGDGKSGNLSIEGRSLTLNNSVISASSSGQGDAGNILLQATDAISLNNSNVAAFFLGTVGKGGTITVQAGSLLADNSVFNTSTFGRGDAGNIVFRTDDAVSLTNGSLISSAVVSFPEFGITGIGNSGTVQIDAAAFSLSGDSRVSTDTAGIGNAGSISINVDDFVRVDNSTISSLVAPGAIGKGGNTRIQAKTISLLNRSRLATGTAGTGDAGNLSVQANESVQLTGNSLISSSVQSGGIGKAGDVSLQTRSLTLTEGSQIQSAIFSSLGDIPAGQGQGGTVRINATDSMQISGTNAQKFPSALITTADVGSQGRAGNLYVTTPNLQISDRAIIAAETRNADPGGNIELQVGNLTISNNGAIRTTASHSGNAGTIAIQADAVQVQNGNIAAAAAESGGGKITVNARDVRLRENSLINTNVAEGASGGGNISISANTVLALEDSDILANANQGRGGNITIRSNAFVADFFSNNRADSVRYTGDITPFRGNGRVDISASSAVGISGSVTIPDFSFLQDNLTQLPQSLIDPNTLLANSCIVRSRESGSFLITGSGGLAERPGDAAIAGFATGAVRSGGNVDRHTQDSGTRIVEPQGLYRLANGQLVLSRDCSP